MNKVVQAFNVVFNAGDNKGMTVKQRFIEYASITMFVWTLYLIWLLPFQKYWVGMSDEQLFNWLFYGTMIEFVLTYFIVKITLVVAPKITRWSSRR